jgi:hypothetical protein
MTDTHSRPEEAWPSWGPAGSPPPFGAGGHAAVPPRPAPTWPPHYPDPSTLAMPPSPPAKRPRRALRILAVTAAVVFGIPGALFVAAIVYLSFQDAPASMPSPAESSPTAASPPTPAGDVAPASALPAPSPFGPLDLNPGDCYNGSAPLPPDGSTVRISSVDEVACSEPHTGQVVATFSYTETTWNEGALSRLEQDCKRAFGDQLARNARSDSRYRLGFIRSDDTRPIPSSVRAACIVETNPPTTGSALAA